jgi:pimeloyl-ACP methyl ester carboxylesterase
VLVGEEDILKPPKYAQIMVNEIPDAEFILIPNAGHAVCIEKHAAFNSVLLGFLMKHSEVIN